MDVHGEDIAIFWFEGIGEGVREVEEIRRSRLMHVAVVVGALQGNNETRL